MIRIKQLARQALRSGKFEITQECGCYCLYRLIRNSNGDVIKVLVMNTADLTKAIIKMVQKMQQGKNEQSH